MKGVASVSPSHPETTETVLDDMGRWFCISIAPLGAVCL